MSTLGIFLVVLIVLGVLVRLFGRTLLRWALKLLARQAMKHMQKQSEAYQRQYSGSPYEERIRTGEGQELRVPRQPAGQKKRPGRASQAEDVEYEEL